MKKTLAAVAIAVIVALLLTGCGNSTASNTTVNGNSVSYSSSGKAAVKAVSTTLSGEENEMVVDLTTAGASKCKVTATGQTSGKVFTAGTDDVVTDIVGSVKGLFSANGVSHVEGNKFAINANAFDDGETVVVELEFVTSSSALDQAFGKGGESKYWAFTAQHDEDETETEGESETAAETESEAESEAESKSESETETTEEAESLGKVYFNGFALKTYADPNDAIANATAIAPSAVECSTLTAETRDGISNVQLYLNGADGTDLSSQYILTATGDWTQEMNLTEQSGQIVVFHLIYIPDLIIGGSEEYLAISVPAAE